MKVAKQNDKHCVSEVALTLTVEGKAGGRKKKIPALNSISFGADANFRREEEDFPGGSGIIIWGSTVFLPSS